MKAKTEPMMANVSRSSAGLRDAIFDEIDAIRNGTGNPTRANAVAKLAAGIVDTVRVEIEAARFTASAAAKQQAPESPLKPLALGLGS